MFSPLTNRFKPIGKLKTNEKYLVLSVPIRNLNSQQSAYCGFEIKSRCL